jgi:hypothetical protein
MTLREARAEYFAANGLPPDGGYHDRWVRIQIGPIPFAYPNTEGRRRVTLAHDLHHVLTGYRTDIRGEAELAAWEIGAGCRDRAGLQLELRVLGFGLLRWPREVYRAFLRGRRSRNLLGTRCDDAFVARPVETVRAELGIDPSAPAPEATSDDRRAFARWALLAIAIVWGPLIPLAALAWWWWR